MSDSVENPLKRSVDETVGNSPETKKPKSAEDVARVENAMDEDEEDDEMAGLDEGNIIVGSRTRGKKIDFTKAIEAEGDEEEDDDEDVVLGDETMDADDDDEEDSNEEEDEEEENGDAEVEEA
ncbi:hypothetical protein BY996DRAFT_6416091 [Phakopsora pachyrhizi]|uniref:Expressed protein n=1 Tax=Phakopsora pachyrhizi TaxID=170000 RepID=A0AAV0AUY1_PHAPC|nr:hypothetical protein BY996DRAFT_6422575 [Phakopsora pachyrhizi]KAI8451763.1 hypothetical protein BY996DRAFT_6416091 [Phakopsora pachyrhizi]CAH7673672.1 expressed protein [Phakopsora pachyrhizi]